MLRHGNFVYVVFRDDEMPVVVKFILRVAGLESEEISPETSDKE